MVSEGSIHQVPECHGKNTGLLPSYLQGKPIDHSHWKQKQHKYRTAAALFPNPIVMMGSRNTPVLAHSELGLFKGKTHLAGVFPFKLELQAHP